MKKIVSYSIATMCIVFSICAGIATYTYYASVTKPKVKCTGTYGEYTSLVKNQEEAAVVSYDFSKKEYIERFMYEKWGSSNTELFNKESEEWKEDRKKYTE